MSVGRFGRDRGPQAALHAPWVEGRTSPSLTRSGGTGELGGPGKRWLSPLSSSHWGHNWQTRPLLGSGEKTGFTFKR
jgi:hypothetical protein